MKSIFEDIRIAGILSVMPESEVLFDDEVSNYAFPEKQTMRLKKVMGYEKHRLAKKETATSDLCIAGLKYLLDGGKINLDEIGAIVCLTITPDYFVPHVSNIIHGSFDFSDDVVCLDIMQGCCGFMVGMMECASLLSVIPDKKVLLFNCDVLSHKVSKKDRKSFPLIGDAAAITVIEKKQGCGPYYYALKTNSKKRDIVRIMAGGSRMPCSEETAKEMDDGEGNLRSLEHLKMDGNEVFRFVQEDIPPFVNEVLSWSNTKKDDIDCFICHQPNKFVLKKVAETLDIPYEKMPMDIVENYGNSSGATVPVTITHALGKRLCEEEIMVCMIAFGSGMTWSAMVGKIGKMDFCEMLITNC